MTGLDSALLLLAIFWLPGLAIFAVAAGNGAQRWPWVTGGVVSLAAGVAVSGLLAVGLGAFGIFGSMTQVVAVVVFVLVVIAAGGGRVSFPFSSSSLPNAAGVVSLLILAGAMFLGRPFEMLLGGRDATTYLIGGIALSRQGSLVLQDRAIETIGSEAITRLRPATLNDPKLLQTAEGVKYQGFFYVDIARGYLIAQGCHLWPAVIAIVHTLFGLSGAFAASNLVGMLAVAAVFTAGTALVGPLAAFLGSALLSVSAIEVWSARYPVAEILFQAFLFAGITAFLRRDRLGEGVAALLLGATLFTKIEAGLLLVPLGGLALADLVHRRRLVFWATFVSFSTSAIVYWSIFQPSYVISALRIFSRTQDRLWERVGEVVPVFGLLVVLLVGGVSWWIRRKPRVGLRRVGRPGMARILAAAIVPLTIYGYWLRPLAPFGPSGAEKTFVWLSWYVTPVALLVGIAGLAVYLWREPPLEELVMLAALLLLAFVFLQLPFVNLRQIYMTRRFVPAALPLLLLFFGFAVAKIAGSTSRRRTLAALGSAVTFAVVFGSVVSRSAHIYNHREYPGLASQISDLAEQLKKSDLVLLSDWDLANGLGPALEFVYDVEALVFWPRDFRTDLVQEWLDDGQTLTLLTQKWSPNEVAGGADFDLVEKRTVVVSELEGVYDRFPQKVARFMIPISRYEAGEGATPLYEFWKKEGERLSSTVCDSGVRLLGGTPFLVRRVGERCGDARAASTGYLVARSESSEWERWLQSHGARFDRMELGDAVLLSGLVPVRAPRARRLSPDVWEMTASSGDGGERLAVDGNPETRWGSGTPQRPGMTFTIDLAKPFDLAWLRVRVGRFHQDRARGLAIETSADGIDWERLEIPRVDGAIVWDGDEPRQSPEGDADYWIGRKGVRYLRLENLGESSYFDWSIAEIEIEGRPASEEVS